MKSGTVKCYGQSFSFKKSVLQRKNKYVKSKKASKGQIIDEEIRHLHDRISKGVCLTFISVSVEYYNQISTYGVNGCRTMVRVSVQIFGLYTYATEHTR